MLPGDLGLSRPVISPAVSLCPVWREPTMLRGDLGMLTPVISPAG